MRRRRRNSRDIKLLGSKMSVMELSRSEGMQYALQKPVYQQDKTDCLVNQTKSFSSGTLYLNEE